MKLNIVTRNACPEPPYQTELFELPIAVIPFLLQAINLKAQKYWWLTPGDQRRARTLMALTSEGLLMPIGSDILNAVNRVGNLLDAAIFYHNRSVVSGSGTALDPYVYDPPIETTWDGGNSYIVDIDFQMNNLFLALQNLLNGTASGDFPDTRNFRDQLAAIQTAIEGATTAENWSDLLSALSSLATTLIEIGETL